MKRFFIKTLYIFACIGLFSACMKGPDFDAIEKSIFLDHTALYLLDNETITVIASPTNEVHTWLSENTAVATVNQSGEVKAVAPGETRIVVSCGNTRREIPTIVTKFIPVTGISVSESELSMLINRTVALETAQIPDLYTERVPFNLIWQSSNTDIATVNESGIVSAVDVGEAVITVSIADKPSVKTEIPVTVYEVPITDIVVSKSPLNLLLDETVTLTTSFLPLDYAVKDASIVWSSSNTSVVKVTNGKVEAVGDDGGAATITVSLAAKPSTKTDIPVTVLASPATNNIDLSLFADQGSNIYYAKVNLVRGGITNITGMNPGSTAEEIYNRDFFIYNAEAGRFIFSGETGEWDVYYSPLYNHIWVLRQGDIAPAAYWIIGDGFCNPPNWKANLGGWDFGTFWRLGYMRSIGDGKYQASIYIVNGFDIQIHADRSWNATIASPVITGAPGIVVHSNTRDIVSGSGFVPGYYRLTFDAATKGLYIENL